jgi:hypothetical protein
VQPLRNPPAFHGTRRFNTVFTRALHLSLSWAISIQSTASHPVSLRYILCLPICNLKERGMWNFTLMWEHIFSKRFVSECVFLSCLEARLFQVTNQVLTELSRLTL